jgi:hypothetical protein
MFSFFKRKPKEHWQLVKTISISVSYYNKKGKVYYHLFESNIRNRKTEIKCSIDMPSYLDLEEEAKRFDTYQEIIYRWEKGRVDPDIPTYDQIPEEETVAILKGKVM